MRNPIQSRCCLRYWILLLPVTVSLLCTTAPNEPEMFPYAIRLSLGEKGVSQSVYRGTPLNVIVEAMHEDDTIAVEEISWTLGQAKFVRDPLLAVQGTLAEFETQVYWNTKPFFRDSSGRVYDTIRVEARGGIVQSNTIRIYVENIAPVLHSVTVDRSIYPYTGDILAHGVDSAKTCTLSVSISDIDDQGNVSVGWSGANHDPTPLIGAQTHYHAPDGGFIDTVNIHVYDPKGASVRQKLVLFNRSANVPPVISSVSVNGERFDPVPQMITYQDTIVDTVELSVVANDPDKSGPIAYRWSTKSGDSLSVKGNSAMFVCDGEGCATVVNDTLYNLETVYVTVRDPLGDSARVTIQIMSGVTNSAPVIDSIAVEDSVFKAGATVPLRFPAKDSVGLRVWVHDPNAWDSATWSISSRATTVGTLDSTVSPVIYYPPDGMFATSGPFRDTIVVRAVDEDGLETVMQATLWLKSRAPEFDSIVVEGAQKKIFNTKSESFDYSATAGEDVTLTGYAMDPDESAGDSVSYFWEINGNSFPGESVSVKCDSTIEVTCIAQDVKATKTRQNLTLTVE